jgi:hypothetical protein
VITATSVADPTKFGTALVTVLALSSKNFVVLNDGTRIIVDDGGYVLADDDTILDPVPPSPPVTTVQRFPLRFPIKFR